MPPGFTRKIKAPLRTIVILCFCCSLFLFSFPAIEVSSIPTQTSTTVNEVSQITPGSSTRRGIAGGSKEIFHIDVGQNRLLRLTIEKGDLALSAAIYDPTGTELVDYRSHRFEVVTLSVPAGVSGAYQLEIESHESTDKRSEYELRVEPLTTVTSRDLKDSEARQAMARAEKLRASWTEARLKQSIEEYDKASLIWISINDSLNASIAALRSGEVYFNVSKYSDAFKRVQNAAELARKAGDAIAESQALGHAGLLYSYLGDNSQAQKELTKARQLVEPRVYQSVFAQNAYGLALSNLAEVNYAKGYLTKAASLFDEARKFLQGDRRRLARIHLFTGYIFGTIGDSAKADAEISRARELYQTTTDKPGEGLALTLWGLSFAFRGKPSEAIDLHRTAIEIFRSIGDRHSEAIALNGLGQVYEKLNYYDVAISQYENVQRIAESIGSPDLGAAATLRLATIHRQMGQLEEALTYNRRCLELSRAAGKVRFEAHALSEIATIYADQGRHAQALQQFGKIRKFYEGSTDRIGQALALNTEGDFLFKLGAKRRALEAYSRALPVSEKIDDQDIVLATLYNLARTHSDLGNPDLGLSLIKRSLTIIEDLRKDIGSPDLRVSYFSEVRKHYDLCVDILMQLEQLRPNQGYAAEALLVNDQSRARSLVDLLGESQASLLIGAPEELVKRERELRGLLGVQAQYEMQLKQSGENSPEAAEVANDMARLRSEYQEIQLKLRQRKPHLLRSAPPPLVSLVDMQNELRDGDTMLLQFFLGKERSYAWAVTNNSLRSYQLPPAAIIEDAVIEVYKLTTARQETDVANGSDYQTNVKESDKLYFHKASSLSNMLLRPVAEQLGQRRLVIVADGALQYTQFEALPTPLVKVGTPFDVRNPAEFLLIGEHEIIGLPSFSALKAIRAQTNTQSSPDKLVAVIADPVFSASDDRVQVETRSPVTTRTASKELPPQMPIALRGNGAARLAYSSAEAVAITSAAPGGTTMVAKGFDANRRMAMSSQLGQYQIVHFATHGFLDGKNPELSSIVLSLVDRNGTAQNGLMSLHDINSLDLSAQLTVLSACQTALGKDIKGEGLVGLTQGFMSAGSKSVVASLWKVDDRATAILMADFYRLMLQQGMTPAAALRSAKLKMMRDKEWRAPYYWAGFTLQGEYTNRITVDSNSWLRPRLLLLVVLVLTSTGLLLFQRQRRAR